MSACGSYGPYVQCTLQCTEEVYSAVLYLAVSCLQADNRLTFRDVRQVFVDDVLIEMDNFLLL